MDLELTKKPGVCLQKDFFCKIIGKSSWLISWMSNAEEKKMLMMEKKTGLSDETEKITK